MAQQSPDYKTLFFEEQRRREDAERRREDAERRREEEQRRREEEQRRREEEQRRRENAERAQQEAEDRTRMTTLFEFLDGCHTHLHLGLTVQKDNTLSTQGDPMNAHNKIRPERMCFWDSFAVEQEEIWAALMTSNFPRQRHFTSLHTLEESSLNIRRRMLSSELDLNYFQRSTVEDHVTSIVQHLHKNRGLRRRFCLKGTVTFENHSNTLSQESIEDGLKKMGLDEKKRRRSPRLQVRAEQMKHPDSGGPTHETTAANLHSIRPRADQFCVYNTSDGNSEQRVAAFIVEYKAPHKLNLGYIYEGLGDMNLEEIVRIPEDDSSSLQFRRLIAAVITQTFSYMVRAGVEYGCVCTGEASIFLRVPDDPTIIYYYLAVPKGDVGETTGWTKNSETDNRLHLTAVGQMLAFTLRALKTAPRDRSWRNHAISRLKTWEIVYDEILETIDTKDVPSSEYRPPQQNDYIRMSPVRLRQRRSDPSASGCSPTKEQTGQSDDEHDPDTPSRPPQRFPHHCTTQEPSRTSVTQDSSQDETTGQYCTQECLLGLIAGGKLDKGCPNAQFHGKSRHAITRWDFLDRIRRQILMDPDEGCEQVGRPGSRGALFKVRLTSHRYTVAAKGTVDHFVPHLKYEATIYDKLRPIQGKHVPVHLGSIDLEQPLLYDGFADIVHMMLLSYGGRPMSHVNVERAILSREVEISVRAVHKCGVLQCDPEARNLLWSEGHVMMIDFERARVTEHRKVLGVISPNRKRKGPEDCLAKESDKNLGPFSRELRRALLEVKGPNSGLLRA